MLASFCLFSFFHIPIQLTTMQFEQYKLRKRRWCAWESNTGRQDGRRRWIQWPMVAPWPVRCLKQNFLNLFDQCDVENKINLNRFFIAIVIEPAWFNWVQLLSREYIKFYIWKMVIQIVLELNPGCILWQKTYRNMFFGKLGYSISTCMSRNYVWTYWTCPKYF